MRILFLCNKTPYPPKDGGSIATFGIISALADNGHDVTVLAMNTKKHHTTPFDIPEDVSAKITFHLVEVPALITIGGLLRNFLFSKLPYNAERFINKKYRHKLKKLLNYKEFDIIQLEGLYLYPYINTIKKYSNAQISYRSHNIEHEIWERTAIQSRGIKKAYLKILAKRLKKFEINGINQYDYLIPITLRDEKKLTQMGNAKPAITIPAGMNECDFSNSPSGNDNIFFIGALDWLPNQEALQWFLNNCFDEILAKKPNIKFVIAGRNAPDWFENKLSHPNIEYLGEIPDAKKFINKNGIMIAPLLSGSGMRVKIVEGMALSKTIVTTSIGCEGISVKNREHLFIADKPKIFSEIICQLLNDNDLNIATGKKAFNFAYNHFHNHKLANKLIDFFNTH